MKNRSGIFPAAQLYTLILLSAVLSACEDKIEVKEIWVDKYVEQKLDTTSVIDNWYLDDLTIKDASDTGSEDGLLAMNIHLDGENIYIANKKARCIEVFDARSMEHKQSISHDGKTLAQDVYVNGDHIFVATGEMCAIQIFDKKDGKYLTRIGTGSFTGNVSKSGCVAANEDFIFVRDSKYQDIRVFERSAISMEKGDNNTIFARLDTKGFYIASPAEPLSSSYDMNIVGDSLYTFIHCSNLVLAYSLKDVRELKDATPVKKTQLDGKTKIYAISAGTQTDAVWVSMEQNGKKNISEFRTDDFHKRDFSSPLRSFTANGKFTLPAQPMFTYFNETLIYTSGESINKWNIKNNPTYIIEPLTK